MKAVIAISACLFCLQHSFAFADAFSDSRSSGRQGMATLRPSQKKRHDENLSPSPLISSMPVSPLRGGGGGISSSSSPLGMSPVDLAGGASSSVIFDDAPFLQHTSIICITNAVGFLLSVATGSFLHVDLLGSAAFGLAAALPLCTGKGALMMAAGSKGTAVLAPRIKASAAAVSIWSAKLGGFLLARAAKSGHDRRVSGLLETTGGAAAFWIFSAIWGIFSSLPHSLGTTSTSPGHPLTLAAGTALFAAGFVIETLADLQKWNFKEANPGKFCNVGLWSISQHPNFWGNVLLWGGILIMNAPALIEPVVVTTTEGGGAGAGGTGIVGVLTTAWSYVYSVRKLLLAAMSVGGMYMWFLGQANGTLTTAVELANERYGNDPAYREYVENVPLIVPDLFKLGGKK